MILPILLVNEVESRTNDVSTIAIRLNSYETINSLTIDWDDWDCWINGSPVFPVRCEIPKVYSIVTKKGPREKRDASTDSIRIAENRLKVNLPMMAKSVNTPFFLLPYIRNTYFHSISVSVNIGSFADLPDFAETFRWSKSTETITVRGRSVAAPYVSVARKYIDGAGSLVPTTGHYFPIQVGVDFPVYGVLRLEESIGSKTFRALLYMAGTAGIRPGVELIRRVKWEDWRDENNPILEAEAVIAVVNSVESVIPMTA